MGRALLGMMSETTTITRPELIDYVLTLCENCDLGLNSLVRNFTNMVLRRELPTEPISKRIKRLTVKSFMDAWTLNAERLQQCCVHVGSTNADATGARPLLRPPGLRRAPPKDVRRHGRRARPAGPEGQRRRRWDAAMSTEAIDHRGEVGPWSYPRRTLSRPEKYERLAFTFCRMGTMGAHRLGAGPAAVRADRGDRRDRAVRAGDHAGRRLDEVLPPPPDVHRRLLVLVVAIADAYWIFVLGVAGRSPDSSGRRGREHAKGPGPRRLTVR